MRVWCDCRCGRHPAAHTEMHDDPWSSRRTVRAVVSWNERMRKDGMEDGAWP